MSGEVAARQLESLIKPLREKHTEGYVLTHGDLHLDNINVRCIPDSKGGRTWTLSGILDWGRSGFCPRVYGVRHGNEGRASAALLAASDEESAERLQVLEGENGGGSIGYGMGNISFQKDLSITVARELGLSALSLYFLIDVQPVSSLGVRMAQESLKLSVLLSDTSC